MIMVWSLPKKLPLTFIVSPSTIDKVFEIYTFFENTTENYTFFENRTEIYTFFENRCKIYTCILFENRTEISNILSMVDGLSIILEISKILRKILIFLVQKIQF